MKYEEKQTPWHRSPGQSADILKEAKARGLIPAIKPILDELIAAGAYISETLYQAFLDAVGEG